jgi:hypothetical protein
MCTCRRLVTTNQGSRGLHVCLHACEECACLSSPKKAPVFKLCDVFTQCDACLCQQESADKRRAPQLCASSLVTLIWRAVHRDMTQQLDRIKVEVRQNFSLLGRRQDRTGGGDRGRGGLWAGA